jgi:Tol biopolymer transport system component
MKCNNPQRLTVHCALVTVSAIFSIGCSGGNSSRLSHYQSGGSFFGGGPSISSDGAWVLFASPRTGNGDIYQVRIDGTGLIRLTTNTEYECDAHWSPDGRAIAYVREVEGQGDIWIMSADGSDQKPLTTKAGDEGGPRFASDNSAVFWRTDPKLESEVGGIDAREVWLIDINTRRETRVTENKVEDVFPDSSSDGKYLSFTRSSRTWIYDRTASVEREIGDGSYSTFSPDGRRLAAVTGQYGRNIDVLNVDGSERRTIYSKNTTVSHPAFLPDGSGVLFLEEPEGRGVGKIRLTELKDGSTRTIIETQ